MPRTKYAHDKAFVQQRQPRKKRGPRPDGTQRSVEKFAGDAYSLARRAVSGLDQIRRFINIETKNFDLDTTFTATTTAHIVYASGIAQGTDQGQRVGNSIKLQHISVIGRYQLNTAVTTFSTLRFMLIRDMENPGSQPVASDIFETVSGVVTSRSPLNWTNRKRFSVLYDQIACVDVSSRGDVVRLEIPIEKHINYRSGLATVAAAAEGSLFWVAVSDEVTNNPALALYTSFQFTDD